MFEEIGMDKLIEKQRLLTGKFLEVFPSLLFRKNKNNEKIKTIKILKHVLIYGVITREDLHINIDMW